MLIVLAGKVNGALILLIKHVFSADFFLHFDKTRLGKIIEANITFQTFVPCIYKRKKIEECLRVIVIHSSKRQRFICCFWLTRNEYHIMMCGVYNLMSVKLFAERLV